MDLNQDELRRQLRDADREQRAALPRFREMVLRHFSGDRSELSPEAKAEMLGVPMPGRRQLFRVGGAAVLGAAVLAACGDDDDSSGTGVPGTGSGTDTTQAGGNGNMDVALARTAASLELAAIAAYTAAIDSGLVTTLAVADAAVLFRGHHEEHAGVLNQAATSGGGQEVTEPNAFVMENVVGTADLSSELSIVQFARALEDVAAATYVFATGALSTPALRQALMSIGGVESRHVTALDIALQALGNGSGPQFEYDAFYQTTNRAPDEAILTS